MLAGAYPSDEFAELKPRVVWDRVTDVVEGRRDARVVAITSGGTIPDRGLFGVFMAGEAGTPGRRVGELDEEMVYELRAGMHGDVIVLGASSWRVDEIGHDRVTVTPAPGVPGKLPFWKGDAVGRPIELGRAMGAFIGEMEADLAKGDRGRTAATTRLRELHDLDERAADNLLAYLDDEREATGALPTDKRIVVERFRDELGDWRLCLLTPFGGRVHAPWSLAIEARLLERLGLEVQTIWSDDGIAIRLPEGDASLEGIEELLFPDADEVEDLVVGQVATSALFASRFRENAARALLLPRRRPGTRTPLWQQRQRAADLLAVARRYGSFPILVETYRECLSDVFDLPALREVLAGVARREIAVHGVETQRASPFASSLLFDYVAAYMYDGDAPLAERRAGALTLDRDLLRELLGQEELRELLDPEALADLELSLQALTDDRKATTVDGVHDLLRRLGDLSLDEVVARVEDGAAVAAGWLAELASAPPGRPDPDRRRGPLDRHRGRRPLSRRRRRVGAGRRAGGVPRPGDRARSTGCSPDGPARTARSSRPSRPAAGACRRASSRTPWSGCWSRARCSAASSGRAARNASGATRTSCACSAAGRWRGCAARSSRSTRPRSGGSCRAGTGSRRSAVPGPRSVARRPSSGWPRSSTSWPGSPIPASVLERDVLPARDPGLPAAAARRAGLARRGRVGGAGEPRPRRRAHRPVPPGPRRAATGRAPRRHGPAGRAAPRPHPRAPRDPRRLVLPRPAPRRGRRPGPRGARCALGPGLGGRGHQRHVRAAARPPLEADRWRRHPARAARAGSPRSARPRRPAAGRSSSRRRARRPSGSTPSRWRCSSATAC